MDILDMGGGGSSKTRNKTEEQQEDENKQQDQQKQEDDTSLSEFKDDADAEQDSDERAQRPTTSGSDATVAATGEATPPQESDGVANNGERREDSYNGRYRELSAAIDDLVAGEASDPATLTQQLLRAAVAARQAPDPTAAEVLDTVLDQTNVSDSVQDELVGAVNAAETADRSTATVLETYLQGRHTGLREALRNQLLPSENDSEDEDDEEDTEEAVLPMQVRLGNGARESVLEDLSGDDLADQVAEAVNKLSDAQTDSDDGDGNVDTLPAFEDYDPEQEYKLDEPTEKAEANLFDPTRTDDHPLSGDKRDAEASVAADESEQDDALTPLTDEDLPSGIDLDTLHPAIDRKMLREAKAAETTADFARAVFPGVVQAPWVRSGEATSPPSFPIAEDGHKERYGGFSEYDPDDVASWASVEENEDETGGARGWFMERGDVSDTDGYEASKVYAVQYGVEAVNPNGEVADRLPGFTGSGSPLDWTSGPTNAQRKNEMVMSAACDTIGVNVARHTYDAATNRVIKEGAGRGRAMKDIPDAPDDWLQQVDTREMIDHFAVQVMFGNNDLNPGNIGITEDGNVAMFDFDHGVEEVNNVLEMYRAAAYPAKIADRHGIDGVDQDRITFRAIEIALATTVSGQDKTIQKNVKAYDNLFKKIDPHGTNLTHANVLRNNLSRLAVEANDTLDLHLQGLTWPPSAFD